MRKMDLAVLLVLVASATAWWTRPPAPAPVVTATPAPFITQSGRYQILAPDFFLAGVPIGSTEKAVESALGKPLRTDLSAEETHTWFYQRDGQDLTITFLDGLVVAEGGVGRWAFGKVGQSKRTWFLESEQAVRASFGQAIRSEKNILVYSAQPGELTFHLDQDRRVVQLWITGQVKPLPRK
ncbi:MAG: hypothetical protein U0931_21330 [Vulcanimicrobiota bacterium]